MQFNYKCIAEAFQVDNDIQTRENAVKAGFLERILTRLGSITGEVARKFEEAVSEEEEDLELTKLVRKKSYTKNTEKKKRKGVGYDTNQGTQWDVAAFAKDTKLKNE